jgi:hypothetical protein
MTSPPRRPIFSAGERCFTWVDVIEAARARGSWTALQHELLCLLARESELATAESLPSKADVRSAGNDFRYRLNLLSADEFQGWLASNDVTVAEWVGEMRRSLLEPADSQSRLSGDELERATWVHAVCSGELANLARLFAEEVAVHLRNHSNVTPCDFARLAGQRDQFCAEQSQEPALAAQVESHQLEWTAFDLTVLTLRDEMVAREAAMCVKLDGRSLPDIAAAAGAQLHEDRVLLDDVETSLRTRLIGAYPGDLIGPVDVGRQYDVVLVVRRIAPKLQHHEVRRRAAELVISKALAAEVNRRVNWHEHF